jgi:hypothetical protein
MIKKRSSLSWRWDRIPSPFSSMLYVICALFGTLPLCLLLNNRNPWCYQWQDFVLFHRGLDLLQCMQIAIHQLLIVLQEP